MCVKTLQVKTKMSLMVPSQILRTVYKKAQTYDAAGCSFIKLKRWGDSL